VLGQQFVKLLPAGTATLSYLLQEDTVLAWLTLPTRSVRVYRWAIPYDSLAAGVSTLRSSLGADDAVAGIRLRGVTRGAEATHGPDNKRLATIAARLAAVLIPEDLRELLPRNTDLVLVPQNVLNLLPFGILPLIGGSTLGEQYPIRYAPSLVALVKVQAAEGAPMGGGALGRLR